MVWRRLHNEKLHNYYHSPHLVGEMKSRRLIWTGHVARMEEEKSAFVILTSKRTGKRLLRRPRLRLMDVTLSNASVVIANIRGVIAQKITTILKFSRSSSKHYNTHSLP